MDTGTIKAASVSNLAFDGGSVIVASPIKETKGEVTSVNKTKKEMKKVPTSGSRKGLQSDSVITMCPKIEYEDVQ